MSTSGNSAVDRPAHYTMGKIEVIDFIEDQDLPYHAANAIKYICRYRWKGNPSEDLRKAAWYCSRLADLIDKKEVKNAQPEIDTTVDHDWAFELWQRRMLAGRGC